VTLPELAGLILDVTGEDAGWAARVTRAARLEDDLRLDSVELAALSEELRRRYGPSVDLAGHVSTLDIDAIIGLTVGDVLDYVASQA
jgi:acyl carrier protein